VKTEARRRVRRNQLQDLQAAAEAPHFPQHLPFEQAEQWALLHLPCACAPAVQDEQEEPLGQAQLARNRALAERIRVLMMRFMGGWQE
jgi:hypothetical protein